MLRTFSSSCACTAPARRVRAKTPARRARAWNGDFIERPPTEKKGLNRDWELGRDGDPAGLLDGRNRMMSEPAAGLDVGQRQVEAQARLRDELVDLRARDDQRRRDDH